MSLIQPYPARSTVEDFGSSLEIRIPPRGIGVITIFMALWLVGWAFREFSAGAEILRIVFPGRFGSAFPMEPDPLPAALFMTVWLAMWTCGGAAAVYVLLRTTFGLETIRIGDGALTTQINIFGFGPQREYALSDVKALRANVRLVRNSNRTGFSSALAFDYGARTVRFAQGLDEAQGRQIVERVGARFPGIVA